MANYPLANFNFTVDWGGGKIGFTEVGGLTMSNDVIAYRDASAPLPGAIKMPGLRRFENIILKRGMFTGDNDFYNWISGISQNAAERRDITISLMDEARNVIVIWTVTNAWPCRLSYSHLKSGESYTMMEELEIVHEGWIVQNGTTPL